MVQQLEYSLRTKLNMRTSNVLDVIFASTSVPLVIGFGGHRDSKNLDLAEAKGAVCRALRFPHALYCFRLPVYSTLEIQAG